MDSLFRHRSGPPFSFAAEYAFDFSAETNHLIQVQTDRAE